MSRPADYKKGLGNISDLPLDASPKRTPSSLAACRAMIGMPMPIIRRWYTLIRADILGSAMIIRVIINVDRH